MQTQIALLNTDKIAMDIARSNEDLAERKAQKQHKKRNKKNFTRRKRKTVICYLLIYYSRLFVTYYIQNQTIRNWKMKKLIIILFAFIIVGCDKTITID